MRGEAGALRFSIRHGTVYAYKNYCCRCELCGAASRAATTALVQRRKASGQCVQCLAPAVVNRARCAIHLAMNNTTAKREQ